MVNKQIAFLAHWCSVDEERNAPHTSTSSLSCLFPFLVTVSWRSKSSSSLLFRSNAHLCIISTNNSTISLWLGGPATQAEHQRLLCRYYLAPEAGGCGITLHGASQGIPKKAMSATGNTKSVDNNVTPNAASGIDRHRHGASNSPPLAHANSCHQQRSAGSSVQSRPREAQATKHPEASRSVPLVRSTSPVRQLLEEEWEEEKTRNGRADDHVTGSSCSTSRSGESCSAFEPLSCFITANCDDDGAAERASDLGPREARLDEDEDGNGATALSDCKGLSSKCVSPCASERAAECESGGGSCEVGGPQNMKRSSGRAMSETIGAPGEEEADDDADSSSLSSLEDSCSDCSSSGTVGDEGEDEDGEDDEGEDCSDAAHFFDATPATAPELSLCGTAWRLLTEWVSPQSVRYLHGHDDVALPNAAELTEVLPNHTADD
jgi:hypothetical protein